MAYSDGDDFINGAILSYQQANRLKNHWRGAAVPANIQPGMIFSKSTDDKLYHRGAAAEEEVLQLNRSQDVSPTFLYETLLGRNLKCWWNFEDFLAKGPVGSFNGIWEGYSNGVGAACWDAPGTALRPGIWFCTTGTTAAGYAGLDLINQAYRASILFGGGVYTIEADIYISDLSTLAETYTLRFGFGDSASGDFTDGAYFEYSDAGATPNWYKCTAANSVRTKTDTTVAVVTGAWTRLKIVVNADGTSVEYFINGVSVGVVTTDIPLGAGRGTTAILSIKKSNGITPREVDIDWVWIHINLTATR
jgi:hypothetical protein